jgi:hypothetical protein
MVSAAVRWLGGVAALAVLCVGCTNSESEPEASAAVVSPPTEGSAYCLTGGAETTGDLQLPPLPGPTEVVLTVADGQLAFAAALGDDFASILPGTGISVSVELQSRDESARYSLSWDIRNEQSLDDPRASALTVEPGKLGEGQRWNADAYRFSNKATGQSDGYLSVGGTVDVLPDAQRSVIVSVGTQLAEVADLGADFTWFAMVFATYAYTPPVGTVRFGTATTSCGLDDQPEQRYVSGMFAAPNDDRRPEIPPTSEATGSLVGLRMMTREEASEQCRQLAGKPLRLPDPVEPTSSTANGFGGVKGIGLAVNGSGDLVAFDPTSYDGLRGPGAPPPNVSWYLVTAGSVDVQPLTANPAAPVVAQRASETPPSGIQFATDANETVTTCTVVDAFGYPGDLFTLAP